MQYTKSSLTGIYIRIMLHIFRRMAVIHMELLLNIFKEQL